jgi:hypothetical protein
MALPSLEVTFKPINGKLPAISVPWNTAVELPSGHDLHVAAWLHGRRDWAEASH